ncbi:uncharacterized protein [Dysidea avara]|uniref:uncharacterized protein n=1 Tax=Dysidea avara TaxID=196820 RepID=UPI003333D64A
MVKFKPLHGLLKVFKSKKTTNESLAGPRKLSRLSFNQIWRRLASSSSARTRAGESTITTKSSRSSYLGRLFRRRKQPVAANDLPSSSPEERNMPSSSDDCYGPLVFDHEVALSASITISSSLTTITRDTLTVWTMVY